MRANQQLPVNLDALLLEEKRNVLRAMITTFEGHGQSETVRLARALAAAVDSNIDQSSAAIQGHVEALHKELTRLLNSSSWIWNLKPAQDSAYRSLQSLSEYWPGNNKDDNHEAEDCISTFAIGCPLFLMGRSPQHSSAEKLAEMLDRADFVNEAYVCVGNDFYYLSRLAKNDQPNQQRLLRVHKLRTLESASAQRLKAILGIAQGAVLGSEEQYRLITISLRQIQMLYITRMTGHETYNRLYLSTLRQRHGDNYLIHLKKEPSDPESRVIFGEHDRNYINEMARQRYIVLHGNERGYTPPLTENAYSHAVHGPSAQPRPSWITWGELTTVLGLTLYLVGVVGLCIFSTGALALASLLAFIGGAAVSLLGLALIASEESAASARNQQQAEREMRQAIEEFHLDFSSPQAQLMLQQVFAGIGEGLMALASHASRPNPPLAQNAPNPNPNPNPRPQFGGVNNFYASNIHPRAPNPAPNNNNAPVGGRHIHMPD